MKKYSDKEKFLELLKDDAFFNKHQITIYYYPNRLVTPDLLEDDDVARALLEKGAHLEAFSKRIRSNKDLVRVAISRINWHMEYASDELKDDKNLALEFPSIFQYVSDRLKDDPDVIKAAIDYSLGNYQYASLRYRSDKKVAYDLCEKDGRLYFYVSDELKKDKDLLLLSARHSNGRAFNSIPKEWHDDKDLYNEIADDALKNGYSLDLGVAAGENIKDDFEIVKKFITINPRNYCNISERLKNNEELIALALSKDGNVLGLLSEPLRNRKDIVKLALHNSETGAFFYDFGSVPKDFYHDPEIYELARQISNESNSVYEYLPDDMKQDPDIMAYYGADDYYVTYFWYHGFYTQKEKETIRKALHNHDYQTFMEFYHNKGMGLPKYGDMFTRRTHMIIGEIDITVEENFMKIENEDSEAG